MGALLEFLLPPAWDALVLNAVVFPLFRLWPFLRYLRSGRLPARCECEISPVTFFFR
jgi:hypothetical protein